MKQKEEASSKTVAQEKAETYSSNHLNKSHSPVQASEQLKNMDTKADLLQVEIKRSEEDVLIRFADQQNIHLNNSLRFADAKAGALVTVNGLVLSYVTNLISSTSGYSNWIFKGSLLIIIIAIIFSIFVVFPRNLNAKIKGFVYWEHITNYTKDEFVKAVTDKNNAELLLKESAINNYTQAKILTKKFKQLALGFKISVVGYAVVGVGIFVEYFM